MLTRLSIKNKPDIDLPKALQQKSPHSQYDGRCKGTKYLDHCHALLHTFRGKPFHPTNASFPVKQQIVQEIAGSGLSHHNVLLFNYSTTFYDPSLMYLTVEKYIFLNTEQSYKTEAEVFRLSVTNSLKTVFQRSF